MDLDGRNQVVNLALPVGLDNIRNTCYLNSILQYLYTVKPIHEIVANIDQFGLQDTEASLQNRRIDPGSTHLEKGEAYAGQQCKSWCFVVSSFLYVLLKPSRSCRATLFSIPRAAGMPKFIPETSPAPCHRCIEEFDRPGDRWKQTVGQRTRSLAVFRSQQPQQDRIVCSAASCPPHPGTLRALHVATEYDRAHQSATFTETCHYQSDFGS